MKNEINKFYALDFDRCLGVVDAFFDLFVDVVDSQQIVRGNDLRLARHEVEESGGSFDVFGYIDSLGLDVDLSVVEAEFINQAHKNSDKFLEPGARKLIDFLHKNNQYFCILTYGNAKWQTLKIISAGLGEINRLIIPNNKKGQYIASWKQSDNDLFSLPAECFVDNMPRIAREIVLIDDKVSSFDNLPSGARGYLVQADARRDSLSCLNELPKTVKVITTIDEVIDFEFN